MPLGLQAKLLRVIQEKRVRRLGDVRERPVDVRIIGSASVPPRHAVEHGILRADLYFRLAVVEIGLPPLRERREDIPLLCSHFLQKHSRRPVQVSISPQVMSAFLAYDWPGNVRELEHAIEGSLAFAKDNSIELDHIPWSVRGVTAATWMFKTRASTGSKASSEIESLGYGAHNENTDISKQESIRDQLRLRERRAVEEALKQAGSVSEAARILGMPRQTLQYRMKILGITRQNRRRRTK